MREIIILEELNWQKSIGVSVKLFELKDETTINNTNNHIKHKLSFCYEWNWNN